MSDESDIPERIQELLQDDEIENVRQRNGYAIGNVALKNEDGRVVDEYESAVIELHNGRGGFGHFGGVKFMWADDSVDYNEPWEDDDGYHEAYAHGSEEALEQNGSLPAWFVQEFTDPEDPRVGQESP